jgi:hypothetical protein
VTTYVITEKQRDQRIRNFHKLIAEGFRISAERNGETFLCSSNDRKAIAKAFRSYPNADALIDCTRFGENKKLVLVTIDGLSDHRGHLAFEALEKARLHPGSAFVHKNGLIFSLPRDDRRPDIELAPGIWLRTDIASLPADEVGPSDFVSSLPAILEMRARKVAFRHWTEQSDAHQRAVRRFIRKLSPGERELVCLHHVSIRGDKIVKNWTPEEALLADLGILKVGA